MPSFELPSALLALIIHCIAHFPSEMPNRIEKIIYYLKNHLAKNCGNISSPTVKVCGRGTVIKLDITHKTHIRQIISLICSLENSSWASQFLPNIKDGYDVSNAIMPVILFPSETNCQCSNKLSIDRRPSTIRIYTTSGLVIGHSYHKKCTSCPNLYYFSYISSKSMASRELTFNDQALEQDYILISSQTCFEKRYIKEVLVLVEVSALTFEAVSENYQALHGCHLEALRVEEIYFIFKLVTMYQQSQQVLTIKYRNDSCRKDLERVCREAVENMISLHVYSPLHKCSVPGCTEGFVMADGIEKVHRRICAAPRSSIKLGKKMPRVFACCPETPLLGGANQTGSKYCYQHQVLCSGSDEPEVKRQRIVVTINLADHLVSTRMLPFTDNLPDAEDKSVHTGCKKPEKVTRFYNRTAGLMAIVRPCGMIVDVHEMLTCESPSQLFVQLLRLVEETNIRFVGYDRACEFQPFVKNLAKNGNLGAEILLGIEYLVDRFHIKGHTTPACNLESPDCQFHPDLNRFELIQHSNTECAEQCFSWLGRFKHSMKYMSQYKFKAFLHFIITARNNFIEKRQMARCGEVDDS